MATHPQGFTQTAQAVSMQAVQSFFERYNPINNTLQSVKTLANNMKTLPSKMKLLRYKYHLSQKQMGIMEELLVEGSSNLVLGSRFNRQY